MQDRHKNNLSQVKKAFSMMGRTKLVDLFKLVGTGLSLVCCLVIRGSTGGFHLLRYFSGIVSHPGVLRVSQYVSVESYSLIHYRQFRDLFVHYVDSLMG